MHKYLPDLFVFLDQYNDLVFKNNNINIGIIYRNYEDPRRERELIKIAKACKKNNFKLFVSNDFKLAIKVKADGIYIPAFNQRSNFCNLEKRNIVIIGSAHNQIEIHKKIRQKCNAIFLAPLFKSKKKKFLGIHRFNFLSKGNKIDFYALGGINESNIKKLKMLSIKGFGGIEMFKKKPAYKRPVF